MEYFIPWWGKAKMALAALVAVVVLSPIVYLYGHHKGAVSERAAIEAQAARDAFERIQNLEKNNEAFRNMSDRDRCLAFMRDSGLPVSECDD